MLSLLQQRICDSSSVNQNAPQKRHSLAREMNTSEEVQHPIWHALVDAMAQIGNMMTANKQSGTHALEPVAEHASKGTTRFLMQTTKHSLRAATMQMWHLTGWDASDGRLAGLLPTSPSPATLRCVLMVCHADRDIIQAPLAV
jgi:hypothetical protein